MTAPAIPLCPTPDAHPATCPCPRRTGETYYGQPITTTRDISSYQEQHVTQPETPQFGIPDCTCIPFTRQNGPPRYCKPGDTVDMISGWEVGRDCPHHRRARTTPDNPSASGDAADNRSWTWAQAIATHGLGDTFTVDIDAEHPSGDRLTVEVPVVEARTLHSMLGDALGYSDIGSEFVRQIDHPDWDGAEAAVVAGTCPGVELNPNPCTCSCEGCRHHCGAHQPVASPATAADLRASIAAALWQAADHAIIAEWICCEPIDPDHDLCVQGDMARRMIRALILDDPEADQPAPLTTAVLAVIDAHLPERAQAAIRALEQQRDARGERLAEARETNRRLNYRCQNAEHIAAAFKRAVDDWEWNDKGTYVPLRSLHAIAKAVGLKFDGDKLEHHIERVRRLQAELAAVCEYVRTSDDDGTRTREQVLRIIGPGGEAAR